MKKRFGTFICLCLVLAVLLAPRAFAADIVASGYCGGEGDGTNLTWTLDSEGTLTISGEGKMADYAFKDNSRIVNVIVETNVTSISDNAFFNCASLTDIIISDTVVSIGKFAFSDCISLVNVSLPADVTIIEAGAFFYCRSMVEITIPDNVTSIGEGAFAYCRLLEEIVIPKSVTSIGEGAFAHCKSLVNIVVSEKNTNYVSLDGALYSKDLGELICCPAGRKSSFLISEQTASIANQAFEGCMSLTEVSIPDSVLFIGNRAFYCCTSLLGVTIPEGVTVINKMTFSMCDSLKQIIIPDGITVIGEGTFSMCDALRQVIISTGVTVIGNAAFESCPSLGSIKFEGDAPRVDDYSFSDTSVTAYYPADNPTWTEDKLQNYGGALTWVPYTEDMIYHTRFSFESIPQAEFDIKITVTRLGESADDVAMIAMYSPEGQFLEMTVWELSNETAQTYTLSRDNTDGKIGQIKVFILDSLSNPIPLAEGAEIASDT